MKSNDLPAFIDAGAGFSYRHLCARKQEPRMGYDRLLDGPDGCFAVLSAQRVPRSTALKNTAAPTDTCAALFSASATAILPSAPATIKFSWLKRGPAQYDRGQCARGMNSERGRFAWRSVVFSQPRGCSERRACSLKPRLMTGIYFARRLPHGPLILTTDRAALTTILQGSRSQSGCSESPETWRTKCVQSMADASPTKWHLSAYDVVLRGRSPVAALRCEPFNASYLPSSIRTTSPWAVATRGAGRAAHARPALHEVHRYP